MFRQAPIVKIIAGVGCFVTALALLPFAWISLVWADLWFKLVPGIFALGLFVIGVFLVSRRRSVLSKRSQILIATFISLMVLTPVLLVIYIERERTALQMRAKEFLLRPFPALLMPDSDGNVGEPYNPNSALEEAGFHHARLLIERYANNGRIRWSARIQGDFACISPELSLGSGSKADAIRANEEVRFYMAERNSILANEWRMGFWQWVEDSIEMRWNVPEYEEEDVKRLTTDTALGQK